MANTVEVQKVYVPFAYRFYYRCNYCARALCVIITVFITVCVFIPVAITVHVHYIFRCFFYSVSSGSGREYATSGSHHVRGPGLSSCAWKRVVAT